MKLSGLKRSALLILAFSGLFLGQVAADPNNVTNKATKLQQAYVWYDGQRERQIWFNPALMAEFNTSKGSAVQSAVKSTYADAVLVSKHGAVRLWRLGSGVTSNTAVRAMSSAGRPGNYSPVLHDGPTTTGRMRALPGNIIVYLNPAWDSTAVNAWAGKHRLVILKKLVIGPNIYVIKTGPGLEALNTANALYKSGEVVAAFPDWWEEVTKR